MVFVKEESLRYGRQFKCRKLEKKHSQLSGSREVPTSNQQSAPVINPLTTRQPDIFKQYIIYIYELIHRYLVPMDQMHVHQNKDCTLLAVKLKMWMEEYDWKRIKMGNKKKDNWYTKNVLSIATLLFGFYHHHEKLSTSGKKNILWLRSLQIPSYMMVITNESRCKKKNWLERAISPQICLG